MAKRKRKRKLTAAQKAEKKRHRKEFMTVFINGKMKRVPRPPTIDGMDVDEFIRRNADPIWLQMNEMWEYMDQTEEQDFTAGAEQLGGTVLRSSRRMETGWTLCWSPRSPSNQRRLPPTGDANLMMRFPSEITSLPGCQPCYGLEAKKGRAPSPTDAEIEPVRPGLVWHDQPDPGGPAGP